VPPTAFCTITPLGQFHGISPRFPSNQQLLCYDPFFKNIFHPDTHPHRLERLLSAILKQKIVILKTMSNEGIHVSDHGAFVIMDIVVRLEDGTIINLEIQKVGYRFPAKRLDCYCADLIMREYSRLREEFQKNFRYHF
jgi:hypothetical protein